MRLVEGPYVGKLDDRHPRVLRIDCIEPRRLKGERRKDLLPLFPADQKQGNAEDPAPAYFEQGERGPDPDPSHVADQRLGPAQRRGPAQVGHFTTRFTALPGTTIILATVLPTVRDCTFSSASAAASIVFESAPAATRISVTSLPLICTGISSSSSLARPGSLLGQGARSTPPSPPSSSHNSAARNGANGASSNTKERNSSRMTGADTSPAANCASAAWRSFTSSMMAATQVLKCQRPSKSSVILAMVWWSLRSSLSERPVGAATLWPRPALATAA